MSPDLESTIGRELRENYALQLMDELTFVKKLTEDQPFAPKYFPADVELNKRGAPAFNESIARVQKISSNATLDESILVIDTRPKTDFRNGHIKGAINLQNGGKFETWLGSIINPGEQFYLVAATEDELDIVIRKTAKIGYESNIKGALLVPANAVEKSPELDLSNFIAQQEIYTIIDVRNENETDEGLLFSHALTIPLPELRERVDEIPLDRPIVVHCAAGYRSAAGASIIAAKINAVPVYDIGEALLEIVS